MKAFLVLALAIANGAAMLFSLRMCANERYELVRTDREACVKAGGVYMVLSHTCILPATGATK